MNFHISPIGYKKYSLILIVPLFAVAIAIWVMEAYFGTLYGDLTRIGQLDEGDFGWHMKQPTVSPALLKSFAINEADILVIGDSFSNGLIWQSRLISAGYKPATLRWDQFRPCSLGNNLGETVRQAGYRGHIVIIENVEHGFQNRMSSSCNIASQITGNAYYESAPLSEPPIGKSIVSLNSDPLGGDWVINALINKIKLNFLFGSNTRYMDFGNGRTRVVPIDGCQLFSNKLCDYGLFYSLDFEKSPFNSVGNILAVNSDLQNLGMKAIWLAIPDKATVYLGYGAFSENNYVNIWNELKKYPELEAPDLADLFIEKSREIRDFYKPNDVHLSVNGYLYLGDIMSDLIKRHKVINEN